MSYRVFTPTASENPRSSLIFELTIPAQLEQLSLLLEAVRWAAQKQGMTPEATQALELATEEAADNVCRHAFVPGTEAYLTASMHRESGGLRIRILDRGIPFDPGKIPDFRPESGGSGLGLKLIQGLCDESGLILRPEGKEIHLFKAFMAAVPTVEELSAPDLTPAEEPQELTPRLLMPGDALQLIRLAYRLWAYDYPDRDLYRPENLDALFKGLGLLSLAMFDTRGEARVHAALRLDEKPVELGLDFVDTRLAQGEEKLEEIFRTLIRKARDRALGSLLYRGSLGQSSSAVLLRCGFKACAMLLQEWPGKHAQESRLDFSLQALPLVPWSIESLHVSWRHGDFVRELAHSLGLTAKVLTLAPRPSDPGPGDMEVRMEEHLGCGRITLKKPGMGSLWVLEHLLQEFRTRGLRHAQIRLSLTEKASPWILEGLTERGLLVSGLIPDPPHQAWLLLQTCFGAPLPLIPAPSPIESRIQDYILSQNPATRRQP